MVHCVTCIHYLQSIFSSSCEHPEIAKRDENGDKFLILTTDARGSDNLQCGVSGALYEERPKDWCKSVTQNIAYYPGQRRITRTEG